MKKNQLFFGLLILMFLGIPKFTTAISIYIKIDSGIFYAYDREVSLSLSGPANVKYMKISNHGDFYDADWESYKTSKTWTLDYGRGSKTVYVRFKTSDGNVSEIYRDNIYLSIPENMGVDFVINPEDVDDDEGATETDSRYVNLRLEYTKGVEGYIVSNDNSFSGKTFSSISENTSWVLSDGSGVKKVYVQFLDGNNEKKTIVREITYNQPVNYTSSGTVLKGQSSTIYYLGYDGMIHPFLTGLIYHSWYEDFSDLQYVSNVKLAQYKIGNPVCIRPGTWLLKFKSLSKVYAVEPGCRLKPIASEAEAYILYGSSWNDRIIELDPIYMTGYTINSLSVADEDEEIVDNDRDSLSAEEEVDYGTSDKKEDTDEDNLTDYEEINYWFSDPNDPDTDADGYSDGSEIVSGYSPSGPKKLDNDMDNKYMYPLGSLVKGKNSDKFYYRDYDGKFYYVGTKKSDKPFSTNNFQEKFTINETFNISFSNSGTLKTNLNRIKIPQTYNGYYLTNL